MSEKEPVPPPLTPAQFAAVPRLYANGIALGYSKTECALTFMFGSEPQVVVVVPFPFAKALGDQMAQIVADFERRTGQKVLGPDEIILDAKPAASQVAPTQTGL